MKHIFLLIAILTSTMDIIAGDVIITRDSTKIEVKITEISQTEVRYKESDNLEGPLFVIPIDHINSIRLSNGKVLVYNDVDKEKRSNNVEDNVDIQSIEQEYSKPVNTIIRGHQGYIEATSAIGNIPFKALSILNDYPQYSLSNRIIGGVGLNILYGYRCNQYVFLGVGTGLYGEFWKTELSDNDNYVNIDMSAKAFSMPYYADCRVFLPVRDNSFFPYLEVALGARCEYTGITEVSTSKNTETIHTDKIATAVHFKVNCGIEYKHFIVSMGYQLWGNKSLQYHYFNINIGARIGKYY